MLSPVKEVWDHRSIVRNLAQRELKVKYKKSILGWLWSLLNPLSTLLIFSVVFGEFFKVEPPVAGNGSLQVFALYLFAALVMWNFFSTVVNGSMSSMVGAGPLIRKVYLPAECIPFAVTISSVIQTSIEAALLAVIMLILGNASFTFLLFPVLLVLLMLFAAGIGLVAALLNVYFRDVNYLVGIGLSMLFYATPMIYRIEIVPEQLAGIPVRSIIQANPMTQFVMASRDIFYNLRVPDVDHIAYLVAWSVASIGVGWWIFSRRSAEISEEL